MLFDRFGVAALPGGFEPDWHAIGGMLLGTGAAIAVGERMYVRPQLRAFWMIGHVATTAGLAAGVRF